MVLRKSYRTALNCIGWKYKIHSKILTTFMNKKLVIVYNCGLFFLNDLLFFEFFDNFILSRVLNENR